MSGNSPCLCCGLRPQANDLLECAECDEAECITRQIGCNVEDALKIAKGTEF